MVRRGEFQNDAGSLDLSSLVALYGSITDLSNSPSLRV